jgi:protein TonB
MRLTSPLPKRTRLSLAGASLALHLIALAALALVRSPPVLLAPLNIDVIPQGDASVETVALPGETAPEQAPGQAAPEPQEAPQAALAPPAPATPAEVQPDSLARQAELVAREKQRRLNEKKRQAPLEARREAAEEARQDLLREKQRRAALARRDAMRRAAAPHGGGSEAQRAGLRNGAPARAARSNYGSIISAELNRHKTYPAIARSRGDTGSVGVSFMVGGSGRIVSHSVFTSSGSSALDGAVHAMMRAAHAPPPPGGSFHGSIVVRFNLSR